MASFKIIFIADVVGKPGRHILSQMVRRLKYKYEADYVIANTENAAGGFGITPEMARKVFSYGVDCQTSGNHIWDRHEIGDYLKKEPRLLRPANYPQAPGSGFYLTDVGDYKLAVINLMGRTFMKDIDCPFRTSDWIMAQVRNKADMIFVDMHAEATSEKLAMWHYLDGVVSVVVGTHTHVQTADERISEKGTAYITDCGMTGPYDSILGMKKEGALGRFLSGMPRRLTVAEGDVKISGVIVDIDPTQSGKATSIERFSVALDLTLPLRNPEEEIVDAGEAD